MSKRVRYTGNPPGRWIEWPPGEINAEKRWYVEPNHLLPEDVPAKLRDELAATADFSEVEPTPKKKDDA